MSDVCMSKAYPRNLLLVYSDMVITRLCGSKTIILDFDLFNIKEFVSIHSHINEASKYSPFNTP